MLSLLAGSSTFCKVGQPGLQGRAAGTHSWQKTLLGKAGTATDLDGVPLVYT